MAASQPTFRDLNQQLEDVLVHLQADDVDVDQALKLHEQGTKLVEQLQKRLSAAENQIKTLKAKHK